MISRTRLLCAARIIRGTGTNIHNNIAFESMLIDAVQPADPILFLWQNAPCIVLGRYQNAWSECDMNATKRDNIALSRRFTGGGAVYHDLGNVCFSVVAPKAKYSVDAQNQLILDTLSSSFGIDGVRSGRNDLCTRESNLKFSGQSFRHMREHSLHNGTIMLNVDVDGLGKYLTPDKSKLEAKGVKSVKSRVVNLSTLNPNLTADSFIAAMTESFAKANNIPPVMESVDDLLVSSSPSSSGSLKTTFDGLVSKLTSWDFIYGETPNFSHNLGVKRLSAGQFDLKLNVDKGVIVDTAVFSDCLDVSLVEAVQKWLQSTVGTKYDAPLVAEKLLSTMHQGGSPLFNEIHQWVLAEM